MEGVKSSISKVRIVDEDGNDIYNASDVITVLGSVDCSASNESDDIDFAGFKNLILYVTTGALTGTPTLTVSVEGKDSDGNYYTIDTMDTISTADSHPPLELYDVAASTIRIKWVLGGSGGGKKFANTTIEAQLKG